MSWPATLNPFETDGMNIDGIIAYFSNYTIIIVTLGTMVLGITAGTLGSFALLRKQSLLGDAISHATLPGVCLAFLLTQSKSPLVLLIGAGIAGWLGALAINGITHHSRIKQDAALGIVLSVFFGMGLMLLTIVQRLPTATKAGLDKFLFGNASTLLREDVVLMSTLSLIIFALVIAFWKEFKLIVFDQDYARSIGLNIVFLSTLLSTLIVAAIVIGLQTVGVVLMSAMLVGPAAAARQWTDRLSTMVVLSALFGAAAGVSGAITSSLVAKLPTGPVIVVYLSLFVMVSLFLAPNRGLLWDMLRAYRHKSHLHKATVLKNLLLFSEIPDDPYHAHDLAALEAIGRGPLQKTMTELVDQGLVQRIGFNKWGLTEKGYDVAQKMTKEIEESINVGASD